MEVIQIFKIQILKSYFTTMLTKQMQWRPPNLVLLLALSPLSFFVGSLFTGMPVSAFFEDFDSSLQIHFQQPDTGEESAPQDRPRGGGSRPPCAELQIGAFPCADLNLTALVPFPEIVQEDIQGHLLEQPAAWGRTIAAAPTFWFYIPYSSAAVHSAEFELWDDENHLIVQNSSIQISETPGVISYRPSLEAPLEVGKTYRWHLLLRFDPETPSLDEYVSGRVQRIAFPGQMEQLETASPLQQASLLAEAGIWYDTLTALAKVHIDAPAVWIALLQQVGLDAIAEEPIVDCCLSVN